MEADDLWRTLGGAAERRSCTTIEELLEITFYSFICTHYNKKTKKDKIITQKRKIQITKAPKDKQITINKLYI